MPKDKPNPTNPYRTYLNCVYLNHLNRHYQSVDRLTHLIEYTLCVDLCLKKYRINFEVAYYHLVQTNVPYKVDGMQFKTCDCFTVNTFDKRLPTWNLQCT